ncbi:hypothetical protein G5C51_31740 [Streptomyces sp. A7024]|uniref:DUF4190 domain-containing protein n=1 Tax=Streptomyces coryli TaxID=1128680 RepID=A0A6G4UAV5_9ACTN|nr:hypothetical protein [Streptomyces coryli]NGN68457.1 hypothetical protein [Streptomyces coryli]
MPEQPNHGDSDQPRDPYVGPDPYAKLPPPQGAGLPQYPQQQGPYGGPQPMPPPPGAPANDSKTLSIIAIVLGCISLFICPPLFGGAALVCAIIAKVQNRPLSTPALVVAIVGLVGGIGIGILLWSAGVTYGA